MFEEIKESFLIFNIATVTIGLEKQPDVIIIAFSRVACMVPGQQQSVVRTVNEGIFMSLFSSLRYNTQYNCCVEVFYANSSENAGTCSVGSTQEGGINSAFL